MGDLMCLIIADLVLNGLTIYDFERIPLLAALIDMLFLLFLGEVLCNFLMIGDSILTSRL
jgi:hypothetical protein